MLPILLLVVLHTSPTLAVYNDSIFSAANNYPRPWFAVDPDQIPALASNGLILRQNTITPSVFAQNVVLGIANQRRNDVGPHPTCSLATSACSGGLDSGVFQVAKAVGWLINSNSTLGGGCPVPPPPLRDLQRFGTAIAYAITGADDLGDLFPGESLESVAARSRSNNITVASLQAALFASSLCPALQTSSTGT